MSGLRAAIYCRTSKDTERDGLGVSRQEHECRELATRHGLVVEAHHVFIDNDISASSYATKKRPGYEALNATIEAGEIDIVLAWSTDRLYRQIRDLEHFIEICTDNADIPTLTVTSGHIDLSTASGRMQARMLTAADAYESDRRSERSKAKHRELARNGAWMSGDSPYGYRTDLGLNAFGRREILNIAVVPEEASIIQEACRRIIAGERVPTIAHDFNARGIPAPRGGIWRPVALRTLVCRARNAGLREHVAGSRGNLSPTAENLTKGDWEPILTPEDWALLQVILAPKASPDRRLGPSPLSSLASCGLCGAKLHAFTRNKTKMFQCRPKSGCGKIAVTMSALEDHVTAQLSAHIQSPDGHQMLTDSACAGVHAALQNAQSNLRKAASDYAEGTIDRATYVDVVKPKINDQIKTLVDRIAAQKVDPTIPSDAPAFLAWWEQRPDHLRRVTLAALIQKIEIRRPTTPRGHNRFDPNRVHISWRSGDLSCPEPTMGA